MHGLGPAFDVVARVTWPLINKLFEERWKSKFEESAFTWTPLLDLLACHLICGRMRVNCVRAFARTGYY